MANKAKTLNRSIFVLSILGVLMAIYVLQSFMRQAPIVCVTSGCELVRKARESYLFGLLPVPAVGLVGYSILAICAFLKTMNYEQKTMNLLTHIMLGMASFGVLFVSWFTYMEIFVIKGICTWCALSTVNMYVIFALVLKAYLLNTKPLANNE